MLKVSQPLQKRTASLPQPHGSTPAQYGFATEYTERSASYRTVLFLLQSGRFLPKDTAA